MQWFEMDNNIGRKPEVMRLIMITGDSAREVVGSLTLFWGLVDEFGEDAPDGSPAEFDGLLPGYGYESLVMLCGGTVEFWEAVESQGWLRVESAGVFVPGFQDRFGANAKSRRSAAKRKRKQRVSEDAPPAEDQTEAPPKPKRDQSVTPVKLESREPVTPVTKKRDSQYNTRQKQEQDKKQNLPAPPPPRPEPDSEEAEAAEVLDLDPQADDWEPASQALADVLGDRATREEMLELAAMIMKPFDLLAIVDEFKAHRSRFRSPGAICYRIRNGTWPADVVDSAKVKPPKPRDPLDDRVGPRLDDMSRAELTELCSSAGISFEGEQMRELPQYRQILLRTLDRLDGAENQPQEMATCRS